MGQEALAVTRRSLHGVAELVLAGPQYRATGRLRLRVVPVGFATTEKPEFRSDGLEVAGLGVIAGINGRSPRAIAEELGLTAGRPEGAYGDGSGVDPDETLIVDPDQAAIIIGALVRGQDALIAFARAESLASAQATAPTPVLWPEHFDVAISVGDVTYGVSPGDGFSGEPYAYVGASRPAAGDDAFWNAPFGAARPLAELPDATAVTGFFARGRDQAGQAVTG